MKKCSLSEMHDITDIIAVSANGYPILNKTTKHIRVPARSDAISKAFHQKRFSDRGRLETPFCMIFHELTCPFSYAYHNSGKRIG